MKHFTVLIAIVLATQVFAGISDHKPPTCLTDQTFVQAIGIVHTFVPTLVANRQLLNDNSLLPAGLKTKIDNVRTNELLQQQGIRFQENKGQIVDTDGKVRNDIAFIANAPGAKLYLRNDGISYAFTKHSVSPLEEMSEGHRGDMQVYRLDMTLIGSNPYTRIRAEGELPGYVNYYLPHCPDGITGIKEYSRIVYENVYNNVDLELLSVNGKMKYNFVVRVGGNVSDIKMKYDGASETILMNDGALSVATPLGRIEEATPYTYAGEESNEVSSRFLRKGNTILFAVDVYDKAETLVIDPWATFYGGSGGDEARGASCDGNGNVVITGWTTSTDFPIHNAQQNSLAGTQDAFIVKFNSSGVRQWATYYGGSATETAYDVATDQNGNSAICGITSSANFPVYNAYQGTYAGGTGNGNADAFVVKFNEAGVRQWATFYGGNQTTGTCTDKGWDSASQIAMDGSGNVVIGGTTQSTNFPVSTQAFQKKHAQDGCNWLSAHDVFVVKFSSTGSRLWATYYGGNGQDGMGGLAADGNGNILLTGMTTSTNFPVRNAIQSTPSGSTDAFIVKLNSSGARQWASYYGGTGYDRAIGLAVDGSGNAVICGYTNSTNFPVQNAFQGSYGGGQFDGFVVKFNTSGGRLWATYYGGSDGESSDDIAVDNGGNVLVCGVTSSPNFPVLNALQPTLAGGSDAYIVKFNGSGVRQWATFYGGRGNEYSFNAVAVDGNGSVIMTGSTSSSDFPVLNPWQPASAGNVEAYVVHLNANGLFSKSSPRAEILPASITLYQNYPNPFNPSTTISYSLVEESQVVLKVYNNLGAEVATLVNGVQKVGSHSVVFSAQNIESGVYTYTLTVAGQILSKRMMLVK